MNKKFFKIKFILIPLLFLTFFSTVFAEQATISSFGPKTGPVGTDINIVGTNIDNYSEVLIGNKSVIPKANHGGLMIVNVPNGTTTGKITIKTNNNGTAVSTEDFVVSSSSSNTSTNTNTNTNTSNNNSGSNSSSSSNVSFSGLVPNCNRGPLVDGNFKNPCDFNYFMALINRLISFVLFDIATPFLAIIIIYVAYLFLTSGGSNQTEKAKHILWNVVIGYVIALAAWLVINTILAALGLDSSIETFMDGVKF